MKNCTDCVHWNPDNRSLSHPGSDTPAFCDNNTPEVQSWASSVAIKVPDCVDCPGFKEDIPSELERYRNPVQAIGGHWHGVETLLEVWQELAIFPQLTDNGCFAAIDILSGHPGIDPHAGHFFRVRFGRVTLALGQDCFSLAITLARAATMGQLRPDASTIEVPGQISIPAQGFEALLATFQLIVNLEDDTETIRETCEHAIAKGLEMKGGQL